MPFLISPNRIITAGKRGEDKRYLPASFSTEYKFTTFYSFHQFYNISANRSSRTPPGFLKTISVTISLEEI
jgi:hypothetical protein